MGIITRITNTFVLVVLMLMLMSLVFSLACLSAYALKDDKLEQPCHLKYCGAD